MKVKTLFIVVPMLLLALVISLPAAQAQGRDLVEQTRFPGESAFPGHPAEDEDFENDDDEFADGVAGSYYLDGELTILPNDPVLPLIGLQTYHRDGTLVTTDNGSFVDPSAPQSPGHGGWIRTGELQLTNTANIMLFGTFGGLCDNTPPNPPNPLCLIAVPVGPVDFAADFKHRRSVIAHERKWQIGDCADVVRHVVADPAVSARHAAHEPAILSQVNV